MHTFKYTLLLVAASILLASSAMGAELPYRFQVLDITVPGQQWDMAVPADINSKGQVVGWTAMQGGGFVSVISNGKKKHVPFGCEKLEGETISDTFATSINDRGQVVGNCYMFNDGGFTREVAFIRGSGGRIFELAVPIGTYPQGVSPTGRWITGQHWNAEAFMHCFVLDRDTGIFTQIDFPTTIANADTNSDCFAVNRHGQILGEYVTNDIATNNTLEHGFFIWDKGVFTVPFPLSHDFEGGPSTYAFDFNDDGAIIGLTNGNDGTGYKLFFWDDGNFYDIKLPEGWHVNSLGGMNNEGQFVGGVSVFKGIDPECFEYYQDAQYCAIEEGHGFVATPRR